MKRYIIGCDHYTVVPEEDSMGKWVRYEDVLALIEAPIPKEDPRARHLPGLEGKWVRYEDVMTKDVVTNESLGCNCFHMSELKKAVWICPAHGYKWL